MKSGLQVGFRMTKESTFYYKSKHFNLRLSKRGGQNSQTPRAPRQRPEHTIQNDQNRQLL